MAGSTHHFRHLRLSGAVALAIGLVAMPQVSHADPRGKLVFLGWTADLQHSVWLSLVEPGQFDLRYPTNNTIPDAWVQQHKGLHLSVSPEVEQWGGTHNLFTHIVDEYAEYDNYVDSADQHPDGFIFPNQFPGFSQPPSWPGKPEPEPPSGVTPQLPGGVAPPIGTQPSPGGVMPQVPGGVAPPMGTLPPSGVTPQLPGGVAPPIGTQPSPGGVMPQVPGGVAPPMGTLPPSGVTPQLPGGVAPPIGTQPSPGGVMPQVPGGVAPPMGTLPPSGVTPQLPGGVAPPIGTQPSPGGVMPQVPGGVAPPMGTLPPSGVTPQLPGGVAPPIGTQPSPGGVMPQVPGGVAPPMGTLPPSGVTPQLPGGVAPPIGTQPSPGGVMPQVPGGVAPPMGTLPPSGVTPQLPGGVAPPIGTQPSPGGVMPQVPGGVAPPMGTLPPSGVTPQLPNRALPRLPTTSLPPTHYGNPPTSGELAAQQSWNADAVAPCPQGQLDEQQRQQWLSIRPDCAAVLLPAQARRPEWNAWFNASYYDIKDEREGGDATGSNQSYSLGVDKRLNPDWVLGISLGWSDNESELFNGGMRQRTRGYSVGPYTAYRLSPRWMLDASLSYSRNDNDQQLLVLSGDYRSQGLGAALGVSGQFAVDQWMLRPRFALNYSNTDTDSYRMRGQLGGIDIHLPRPSDIYHFGSLTSSIEFSRVFHTDKGRPYMPYVELGYDYAFERPNDGQIVSGDLTQVGTSAGSGSVRLGLRTWLSPRYTLNVGGGYTSLGQSGLDVIEWRLYLSRNF